MRRGLGLGRDALDHDMMRMGGRKIGAHRLDAGFEIDIGRRPDDLFLPAIDVTGEAADLDAPESGAGRQIRRLSQVRASG